MTDLRAQKRKVIERISEFADKYHYPLLIPCLVAVLFVSIYYGIIGCFTVERNGNYIRKPLLRVLSVAVLIAFMFTSLPLGEFGALKSVADTSSVQSSIGTPRSLDLDYYGDNFVPTETYDLNNVPPYITDEYVLVDFTATLVFSVNRTITISDTVKVIKFAGNQTTTFTELNIVVQGDTDIVFHDFNYIGGSSSSALSFGGVDPAIISIGTENSISGRGNFDAISASGDLFICGNADLTVDHVTDIIPGTSGKTAISVADALTIDMDNVTLTAEGGDGRNGADGIHNTSTPPTPGTPGTPSNTARGVHGTAGTAGGSGENGSPGGSGGNGIWALNVNILNNSIIHLSGGNGGNGGIGGNGSNGGNGGRGGNGNVAAQFPPIIVSNNEQGGNGGRGGDGGNGGDGGSGGDGGTPLFIQNFDLVENISPFSSILIKAGNGGNGAIGGNGGDGGRGGDGGSGGSAAGGSSDNGSRGVAGIGGNGGNSGNGGYHGSLSIVGINSQEFGGEAGKKWDIVGYNNTTTSLTFMSIPIPVTHLDLNNPIYGYVGGSFGLSAVNDSLSFLGFNYVEPNTAGNPGAIGIDRADSIPLTYQRDGVKIIDVSIAGINGNPRNIFNSSDLMLIRIQANTNDLQDDWLQLVHESERFNVYSSSNLTEPLEIVEILDYDYNNESFLCIIRNNLNLTGVNRDDVITVYADAISSSPAVTRNFTISCDSSQFTTRPAPNATGVSLNETNIEITKGSTGSLIATVNPYNAAEKRVIWSSDDESVATVNNRGVITALEYGTTIITATTVDGGYTANCVVTVSDRVFLVEQISLNKDTTTIMPGVTDILRAEISPSNATNKGLLWESSDETVAVVDENGLVTPVDLGTAVITVRAADGSGIIATCDVLVKPHPPQVSIDKSGRSVFTDADISETLIWDITYFGADTLTTTIEIMKNNDPPVVHNLSGNSFDVSLTMPATLKDIYTVRVTITNEFDDTASDNINFEVYNSTALAQEFNVPIVIDNSSDVTGKDRDALLAMQGEFSLSHSLQLNTSLFSWTGEDRLIWEIANENVADVYYLTPNGWAMILPGMSLHPTTSIRIAGYENGSTTLKITHEKTGMYVNIPVSVATLENKLLFIKTTPAQVSQITFTNGLNETKTLLTNSSGDIAFYEPSGIISDIIIRSDIGDDAWIGLIRQENLISGENQSGLYPINRINLTLLSNLTLYITTPNGSRYNGDVQITGGLFENDVFVPSSQITSQKYNNSTDTSGRIFIQLDTASFGVIDQNNKYKYAFEIRFLDGNYAPMLFEIDAMYDVREVLQSNAFTLYLNEWDETRPNVSYRYNNSDTTNNISSIGISDDNPTGNLIIHAALPNGKDFQMAQIKGIDGSIASKQTSAISDYPFLTDISYAVIEWELDSSTIPLITTKSFNIEFTYTDGSSQTERMPFSISNMALRGKAEESAKLFLPFQTDFDSFLPSFYDSPFKVNWLSPLAEISGLDYEIRIKSTENPLIYEWYGYYSRNMSKPDTFKEFWANYCTVKERVNNPAMFRIFNIDLFKLNHSTESFVEGTLQWIEKENDFYLHITDGNASGAKRVYWQGSAEQLIDSTVISLAIGEANTGIPVVDVGLFIIGFLIPDKYSWIEFGSDSNVSMRINNNSIELSLSTETENKTITQRKWLFGLIKLNSSRTNSVYNWYANSSYNKNINQGQQNGRLVYLDYIRYGMFIMPQYRTLNLWNEQTSLVSPLSAMTYFNSYNLFESVDLSTPINYSDNENEVIIKGNENFAVKTYEAFNLRATNDCLDIFIEKEEIDENDLIYLLNQTELVVSVYNGIEWTKPLFLTDNNQPDGNPTVDVDTENKKAVVAWQRLILQHDETEGFSATTELWYSTYANGNWSEPARLDSIGENMFNGYQIAMNDYGFTVIANISNNLDDNTSDIVTYFVDSAGTVTKTILTNGDDLCVNPQIVANDDDFYISWYRYSEYGSDIVVRKLFNNGNVDSFNVLSVIEVSDFSILNPTMMYQLVGNGNQAAILCKSYNFSEHGDAIYAIKILDDSGIMSFSVPMTVVEPKSGYGLEIINGNLSGNQITIEYAEFLEPENFEDDVIISVQNKTKSFENTFISGVSFNDLSVGVNEDLLITFSVANTGMDAINSIEIRIDGNTYITDSSVIVPGGFQMYDIVLSTGDSLNNPAYSILVEFSNGENKVFNGMLMLAKPDVSIGHITTLTAERGIREFSIHLFNDSDVTLKGSGNEVHLSFFDDPMCENPINVSGQKIIVSAEDLELLDVGGLNLHYSYIIPLSELENGEIPNTGIRIYIKAEIWNGSTLVEERHYLSNQSSVNFNSLIRYNEPKVVMTADIINNAAGTISNININNLSMQPIEAQNGNIIATLFDDNGIIIESKTVAFANNLFAEDTMMQSIQFEQSGTVISVVFEAVGGDTPDDGSTPGGGDTPNGGGNPGGGDNNNNGVNNNDNNGDNPNNNNNPDNNNTSSTGITYIVVTSFGEWTGSGNATAKIDADHTKFIRLLLNGVVVDSSAYTVTSGSTVITLQEHYLKTLRNGKYEFIAEFVDGKSESIVLIVNVMGNPNDISDYNPHTGVIVGLNGLIISSAIIIIGKKRRRMSL
ncbi:MAG: Ig-like domain-containing protein [Oscillospiraceae bacterium]|nr:Ig-like domain-containing protein [Oscillospiraceae bacterium]